MAENPLHRHISRNQFLSIQTGLTDSSQQTSELSRTISDNYDRDIEDDIGLTFNNFDMLVKSNPFMKYAPDRSPTLTIMMDNSRVIGSNILHLDLDGQDSPDLGQNTNDENRIRLDVNMSPNSRALPLRRKSLFYKYSKEIVSTMKLDSCVNV